MRKNEGVEVFSPVQAGVDGSIVVRVSKKLYEKASIFTSAYKLTDRCVILINPVGESDVDVTFRPKDGQSAEGLRPLVDEFCNDIIDQQLRLDLEKQYGGLRQIIVEHAFAPIKDLKDRLVKK